MLAATLAIFYLPPETFPPERVAFRLEMAQSGIMQAAARCDSPVTKRSM
jgi:hypothetical protein